MLHKIIEEAQKQDEEAMMKLIEKFNPLFKKYAYKLNYEDAYEDIILYFIELVKSLKLKRLTCLKDEVIVSYINVSIKNYYIKKIQKIIEGKEILMSELTSEQAYYAEVQSAREDVANIFLELGILELLNENERQIICLIYFQGYTTAEIARESNKTRQAVNQLKQRALKKIRAVIN